MLITRNSNIHGIYFLGNIIILNDDLNNRVFNHSYNTVTDNSVIQIGRSEAVAFFGLYHGCHCARRKTEHFKLLFVSKLNGKLSVCIGFNFGVGSVCMLCLESFVCSSNTAKCHLHSKELISRNVIVFTEVMFNLFCNSEVACTSFIVYEGNGLEFILNYRNRSVTRKTCCSCNIFG